MGIPLGRLPTRFIYSEMTRSDHWPIMMDLSYLADRHGGRDRKKWFEARWLQEDTIEEMIRAAWARASAIGEGTSFGDKGEGGS